MVAFVALRICSKHPSDRCESARDDSPDIARDNPSSLCVEPSALAISDCLTNRGTTELERGHRVLLLVSQEEAEMNSLSLRVWLFIGAHAGILLSLLWLVRLSP